MTLAELEAKLSELEDAWQIIERELEACKDRGSRIRELEEAREFFACRGAFWEQLEELDGWTMVDDPDGEYGVHLTVEGWKSSFRRMRREAAFDALAKFTPEQRRQRYEELELRVTALSNEELEINGIFDTERLYISESLSSPLCTQTTPPAPFLG
jgi:hypothetical protein